MVTTKADYSRLSAFFAKHDGQAGWLVTWDHAPWACDHCKAPETLFHGYAVVDSELVWLCASCKAEWEMRRDG